MGVVEPPFGHPIRLVARCLTCHQRFSKAVPPQDPRFVESGAPQLLELIDLLWSHERGKHEPVGRESRP
jgi:hypothetical protein